MPPRSSRRATSKPVRPGHLHVEHHQIWRLLGDDFERRHPVVGLRHDVDATNLAQQKTQLFPREPFIVDDHRPELVGRSHRGQAGIFVGMASSGITIRAHVPSPRHAVELELIVGAVNHAQAFVDVLQPDAAACRQVAALGREPRPGDADAVVNDVDDRVAVRTRAADEDAALADLGRQGRA